MNTTIQKIKSPMSASKPLLAVIASGLLLVSSVAMAQKDVNESREMQADGELEFSLVSGSLSISGWNQDRFELTGQLANDKDKLLIDGGSSHWEIEVKPARHSRGRDTRLELKVPMSALLELSTVSADLNVSGINGKEFIAETVSGDIDGEVDAERLEIGTVSGDVRLSAKKAELELSTVSGDARISGLSKGLEVETVSGDFQLSGENLASVSIESVSGDMDIEISITENAKLDLESHSGTINLKLPADTQFEFDSDTFSGDIDNEFSNNSSAGARIDADTFSGNINIRKQ